MSIKSSFLNKGLQNNLKPWHDINSAVWFWLVLLLGAALRIYNLGTESYWVDEMYTVIEGQQSIHQLFMSGRLDQPLAYYLPFHLWMEIFGATEVSTRAFSALAGIGSLVLIYLIGYELFGKKVGLLSAFLMAISGFQLFYSQETRFYTFFEFTTLLSFFFFVLALKNKNTIYFTLYCVTSILMVYSHTYGVFTLAAQNLFIILQIKKYKNMMVIWFICQILILLAFLPYFSFVVFGKGGISGAASLNSAGISVPSLLDPLRYTYQFIMPARYERSWMIMLANYAVAGALLVIGTWTYTIWQGKSEKMAILARGAVVNLQQISEIKSKLLLVGFWFLSPIILPFIFSFVVTPMYRDRYTICAAPAFYLLLALGIFSIRKVIPVILSLGALTVMIVPSLQYYYVTDIHQQWKEAALYVEQYSAEDEVIVFAGGIGTGIEQKTFDWYYQGAMPNCSLSNELVDPDMKSEALMKCISGNNRFWVLIRNSTEPSSLADTYQSFFIDPAQTTGRLIKSAQFIDVSVYLIELTK